jgi:Fe-Mn family superoxide dismutase
MTFELPPLPYDYSALEPYIDEETMKIHHDKHHGAYIEKLSTALQGAASLKDLSITELLKKIAEVPEDIRTAVRNNGGGHANHSLFWEVMGPQKSEPQGKLAEALNSTFGSYDTFVEKFTNVAVNRFGSGWAWLVIDEGKLAIIDTPNQDSPLMETKQPILGLDVWEHAYYLKYQNRRKDYIDAWWNVVNWQKVEEYFIAS